MKARFFIFIALFAAITVSEAEAQSLQGIPVGIVEKDGGFIYSNPQSIVRVTLTVHKDVVKVGPYARFSQRYLGVIAPLSDRTTYSIVDATIEALDNSSDNTPVTAGSVAMVQSHITSDTAFMRVGIDRMAINERSIEDMAQEAANMIYTIRRRRFDMISGEAGENVFGAGLGYAVEALDKREQEYLSLFLGKQYTVEQRIVVDVIPVEGRTNYTVCRFLDSDGVLADDDLSGKPIILELRGEGLPITAPPVPRRYSSVVQYRFADMVQCRLLDDNGELARARMPIYQMGRTISIAIL